VSNSQATSRSLIDRFFFDWFPGEALGAARFYFGLGLSIYLTIQFSHLFEISLLGAQFHFTLPIWYFGLLGIDHIVPWTNIVVFAALMAACLLFAFGKWTKPAIVAIILAIFYLKGVRDSISGDVHHREIPIVVCLLLFLFSKCDRSFGLDARKRGSEMIEDWEASWPLRAMQIYIVMFYFWALMAKVRVSGFDWFTGGGRIQAMLLSRSLRDGFNADGSVVNLSMGYELAQHPNAIFWIGMGVFAFELFAPVILFVRNIWLRVIFVVGATIFHQANWFLMNVQFYFYPFVFVTFFNMAAVTRWVGGRLALKRPLTAAQEGV
jgi:hypothetical protein